MAQTRGADVATMKDAPESAVAPSVIESCGTTIHERGWSKLKSLDGNSRVYTFSVLTTLALGIAMVYFDVGFLETERNDEVLIENVTPWDTASAAARQILRAVVLLLMCVVIAINAFFMLGINVYPFSAEQLTRHRLWMVLAFVAFTVTNTLVIMVMVTAEIKYNDRDDNEENYRGGFPHYFLFVMLLLSTVVMDWLFTFAFVQSHQEIGVHEQPEKGKWGAVGRRMSSILRLRDRPERKSMYTLIWEHSRGLFDSILTRILTPITALVLFLHRSFGMSKEDDGQPTTLHALRDITHDISDLCLDLTDRIWESLPFKLVHGIASFLTWGMWSSLRRGTDRVIPTRRQETEEDAEDADEEQSPLRRLWMRFLSGIDDTMRFWRNFGNSFRNKVDCVYDGIREDDEYHHSAWVLAAMCTSLVLLVYFGVGLSAQVSGYLDETYAPRRNCAVRSIEENGKFGDFVFRLAGFTERSREFDSASSFDEETLTNLACNVDFDSRLPSTPSLPGNTPELPQNEQDIREALEEARQSAARNVSMMSVEAFDEGHLYRCSTQDRSEDSCVTLAMINQLERDTAERLNETITPTAVFRDHGIGRAIYVFDRILHHLVWAIWLGLMFGLGVGILSLLSVLEQYKRFSLAIRSGFFEDLPMSEGLAVFDNREYNIRRVESIVTERRWSKLIDKYPMGASAFFFGILVSTAVIQLVVFGAAVAVLLAFIASIFEARVFAILRPYLSLLIAFLITWLINGPIAQRYVSETLLVRRYHVYHELYFLLFLLVYTAVHLVLGVFFALMRLLWVLLTTIACLNRLDQNLFPILKGNDLGHKSFMSMVLMQHAFLSNAATGERKNFTDLIGQMRFRRNSMETSTPAPSSMDLSPQRQNTGSSPPKPATHARRHIETRASERTVSFYLPSETSIGHGQAAAYLRDDFASAPESGAPPSSGQADAQQQAHGRSSSGPQTTQHRTEQEPTSAHARTISLQANLPLDVEQGLPISRPRALGERSAAPPQLPPRHAQRQTGTSAERQTFPSQTAQGPPNPRSPASGGHPDHPINNLPRI